MASVGIHSNVLNDLQVILMDVRVRVLSQLSKKLGLEYDELFEKYCEKPVRIVPVETVTNLSIAEFSPDVFVAPPRVPKARALNGRKAPREDRTQPEKEIPEDQKSSILAIVQRLEKENRTIQADIVERLENIDVFTLEEAKHLLERHQDILKEAVAAGLLSIRQAYNSFRRDMMNLLRGTDPERSKTIRDSAEIHSYCDACVRRLENAMYQNAIKNSKT